MLIHSRRNWLRIDDTDIHWAEMGAGRPTILLHGVNDSHRTWDRIAPYLLTGRRLLMPDLPGHGLSGRPDAPYTLEWYSSVLARWMDSLGLEEVDLVGHSFGGGVSQFLLLERRERIRRLALVSSGGLGREVSIALRLAAIPGVVEQLGQPFMGPGTRTAMRQLGAHFDDADIEWLSWVNSMPGTARAFARTVRDVIDLRGQKRHFLDHAHTLPSLPPIGMFWGDLDPVIPVAHGTKMFETIDGVTLTRFSHCGHFPHREHPRELASALTHFLDTEHAPRARLRKRSSPRKSANVVQRIFASIATTLSRLFGARPATA